MTGYYSNKLGGNRLKAMYDSAPPRIQQYLRAEIEYVKTKLQPHDTVLELGCGYGRVMRCIADKCKVLVGIDTSAESLQLGKQLMASLANCHLLRMNATMLSFADNSFDRVLCIQNGLSAFHVDQVVLIEEALRVTCEGGLVVLSTYTERFWDERLNWFEQQARDGFIGPIDYNRTGKGQIVCTDGFSATTVSEGDFRALAIRAGVRVDIFEIDGSSLVCEIRKNGTAAN